MLNYFGFSQFARPISAHLAGILPLQYWFEIQLEECRIILDSRSFLAQYLHSLQGFCHCNIDPELHWKNIEFFWTVAAVLPNFYVPGKNYAIVILFRNLIGRMLNSFGRSQLSYPISAQLARILPLQCWPEVELESLAWLAGGGALKPQFPRLLNSLHSLIWSGKAGPWGTDPPDFWIH